jgi:hypothetical protein
LEFFFIWQQFLPYQVKTLRKGSRFSKAACQRDRFHKTKPRLKQNKLDQKQTKREEESMKKIISQVVEGLIAATCCFMPLSLQTQNETIAGNLTVTGN